MLVVRLLVKLGNIFQAEATAGVALAPNTQQSLGQITPAGEGSTEEESDALPRGPVVDAAHRLLLGGHDDRVAALRIGLMQAPEGRGGSCFGSVTVDEVELLLLEEGFQRRCGPD